MNAKTATNTLTYKAEIIKYYKILSVTKHEINIRIFEEKYKIAKNICFITHVISFPVQ